MTNSGRTEILLGHEKLDKLLRANIIIFGIGGVGGFVAEALARTGIGNITLVDGDNIESTNLNRQIIATLDTIGKSKVSVMAARIKTINDKCNVKPINIRYSSQAADNFNLGDFDYVVDCIDSIGDKKLLIKTCYALKVPVISAMGAGNRYCVPDYKVADIAKTTNDPIAKIIRKFCTAEKIKKLNVVFTTASATKSENVIGSISYHPMAMASIIAGKVVNDIINK